ncbi:MAG: hypothetical protein SNJ55_11010 [Chloroherpetonaceae bacterium]
MIPNKYTALERLQLFKPVATWGVLKAALIEECELSGEPLSEEPTDEQIREFAELIGFKKCENEGCDLWYNAAKGWFAHHEEKNICRMCAVSEGIEVDF